MPLLRYTDILILLHQVEVEMPLAHRPLHPAALGIDADNVDPPPCLGQVIVIGGQDPIPDLVISDGT